MKKFLALLLSIVMLLPAAVVPAAAASYPSVSSSRYIEFKAQESINVYKDKACKTRGTSSPSKKYNAAIAKNDVCYIYEINVGKAYVKTNYPTPSGRRTGYVKLGDLFDKTVTEEYIESAAHRVKVHKADGNNSYVAEGDKVWRVDPKVGYSGYHAVIYEAKSGNRAYKMGYVTLGGWDDIVWREVEVVDYSPNVTATETMTNALYRINVNTSKLTCGFDGYKKTAGRHEGIDFKYANGESVFSLTDGIVTNVVEGKTGLGKGCLSTIAIFDEENNKTVVYLHSNPVDSLEIGQRIKKGDKIATESWRGCSAAKKGHTHVEVREGRRTGAAKSVDNYTLDNKNPAVYWKSLGYAVK